MGGCRGLPHTPLSAQHLLHLRHDPIGRTCILALCTFVLLCQSGVLAGAWREPRASRPCSLCCLPSRLLPSATQCRYHLPVPEAWSHTDDASRRDIRRIIYRADTPGSKHTGYWHRCTCIGVYPTSSIVYVVQLYVYSDLSCLCNCLPYSRTVH